MSSEVFDRCNNTELYQICLSANIKVRPNESREAMIAYLEGTSEPPELDEIEHPMDNIRLALISYVEDHWKSLVTQLTCPMKDLKTTNPRPCFGCLDAQVLACYVSNNKNQRIDVKRLKKENR